jgi:UPF0755 protein
MTDEEPPKKRRSRKSAGARRRKSSKPPPAAERAPNASAPHIVIGAPLRWTLTLLVAVVAAGAIGLFIIYPERRNLGSGRDIELDLVGDESPEALAARLHTAGVLAWPRVFAIYVRARGVSGQVARGAHLLADDLTPRELLARVSQRSGQKSKVVLPEGFTSIDIAKRLHGARVCSRKAFLDAIVDKALLETLRIPPPSAEGFLFPATYEFAQDMAATDVVRRMKIEFDRRYATLEEKHGSGVNDLGNSLGWGRREIVTLASIIEKEAAVDDERPVIAAVFLNRLRDPKFTPKLLQSDPTAAYGCIVDPSLVSCRSFTGKITPSLLSDAANLYNTYKHAGLPPGPIANPGARSLEAVMSPATTRALYFVAKGGGRHTFSETYEAHQAAVKGKTSAKEQNEQENEVPAQ